MAIIPVGSTRGGQPKYQHEGPNAALFRISASITPSLGDIFLVGKLPLGAIPVDAVWFPGPAMGGAGVAKLGTSASQDLFFASATYSSGTVHRLTRRLGTPQIISVSDDVVQRFEHVTFVPSPQNAVSVGHCGDLLVFYIVDQALDT